jgi:pyoverdine/dityrosine biosynthesis protein Dit1
VFSPEDEKADLRMFQPLLPIDQRDRRTRQRLLEAAAGVLSRQGLQPDLLKQAVEASGGSLERAQVFFSRDEELVLALYARFAADLEARILELPPGTIAERFRWVMTAKFAIVHQYREALAVLTATLLDPRHELGALSPQTQIVRIRVQGVVAAVVHGATDCPRATADELIRALYGIHLGLMLLWCQDRSPQTRAARDALGLICDLLGFALPLLAMPEATTVAQRLDGIVQPLLAPADDGVVKEQSTAILRCLFRHRRLLDVASACAAHPCPHCLALHVPRVSYFVRAAGPLHLVLPAFPAKSPSRRKTLGPLTDQAEELALRYLERVCDELATLHPPGVRMTICSDGYVFSDLVSVTDNQVSDYGQELKAMIGRLDCRSLDVFNMADLYEGIDFPAMRQHLVKEYALPLEQVEQRAHTLDHVRTLVNGIHRFLFEEQADLQPQRSRTQVRHECRGLAYQVVQRSDAWGRLLSDCFPTALRLSIHPQHPHSEKIGILLGQADDAWLTPWHAAALHTAAGWKFVRAEEAIALGARLVERDGRPSHFELMEPQDCDSV